MYYEELFRSRASLSPRHPLATTLEQKGTVTDAVVEVTMGR